jgi:hypothetical protein
MAAGTIGDFHRGLSDRTGAPNLVRDIHLHARLNTDACGAKDFEATMRLEHCVKTGADADFFASRIAASYVGLLYLNSSILQQSHSSHVTTK